MATPAYLESRVPGRPEAPSVKYMPASFFAAKLIFLSLAVRTRTTMLMAFRKAAGLAGSKWQISQEYAEWRTWSRARPTLCVALYTTKELNGMIDGDPEKAHAINVWSFWATCGHISAEHSSDGITVAAISTN